MCVRIFTNQSTDMKVKVMVQDRREAERNEAMGLDCEPSFELEDFWFRDSYLESFWIDKCDNEIVFSLSGTDYRTPYSDNLFAKFKAIFE